MYIWRKLATAEWLQRREQELELRFGSRLAVIHRPPRKRIEVEVLCRSAMQAVRLRTKFGGSVLQLPNNWWRGSKQREQRSPIRIGKRMLIVASEEARRRIASKKSNKRVLVIPAGAAFGTGDHPTTVMCLRILEHATRNAPAHWRLLDIGTGTGVLALAGRCLGAAGGVAIDNYPLGIATAKQNATRNRISGVRFLVRDILTWNTREKFDFVTANLFSSLLIKALPKLERWLKPGGLLILSGILRTEEGELLRVLLQRAHDKIEMRRRGKWVAVLARRRGKVAEALRLRMI